MQRTPTRPYDPAEASLSRQQPDYVSARVVPGSGLSPPVSAPATSTELPGRYVGFLPPSPTASTRARPLSSSNLGGYGSTTAATSARFPDPPASTVPLDKPELRIGLTKGKFLSLGLVIIVFIISLPAWDAAYLLNDVSFQYWVGYTYPTILLLVCPLLLILYVCVVEAVLSPRHMPQEQSVQNFVMVLSLFVTLLALCFVLVSMPISQQSTNVANDISYLCGSTVETQGLRENYLQLLALRNSSGCADQFSVEECEGYEAVAPYAGYLKSLEFQYHCSGFCYDPSLEASSLVAVSHSVAPASAAVSPRRVHDLATRKRSHHTHRPPPTRFAAASSLVAVAKSAAAGGQQPTSLYPPMLFTRSNELVKESCDGAITRNLRFVAEDIGTGLWRSGLVLIFLAVFMGMSNWSSMVAK